MIRMKMKSMNAPLLMACGQLSWGIARGAIPGRAAAQGAGKMRYSISASTRQPMMAGLIVASLVHL
jgi:hypothetical protein